MQQAELMDTEHWHCLRCGRSWSEDVPHSKRIMAGGTSTTPPCHCDIWIDVADCRDCRGEPCSHL